MNDTELRFKIPAQILLQIVVVIVLGLQFGMKCIQVKHAPEQVLLLAVDLHFRNYGHCSHIVMGILDSAFTSST